MILSIIFKGDVMNKVLIFVVGVLTGMVVYVMLVSIFNSKNRH
jgi:hypothetical protein